MNTQATTPFLHPLTSVYILLYFRVQGGCQRSTLFSFQPQR